MEGKNFLQVILMHTLMQINTYTHAYIHTYIQKGSSCRGSPRAECEQGQEVGTRENSRSWTAFSEQVSSKEELAIQGAGEDKASASLTHALAWIRVSEEPGSE